MNVTVTYNERPMSKIIGGPELLLQDPHAWKTWAGVEVYLEEFIGGEMPVLKFIAEHDAAVVGDLAWLRRVGVTDIRESRPSSWDNAARFECRFWWTRHGDRFIPLHWQAIGVERALALYRIFGADEINWPDLEATS